MGSAGADTAIGRARAWSAAHPLAVDTALAFVLFLASAVPLSGNPGVSARDWVVAAGLIVPLAWRRRFPLATFGLVALAAFGQWLAEAQLQPADVAALVALYTVAAYERRRWAFPAAFAVCELGVVLAVVRYTHEQPGVAFLSLSAFVVAAGALGVSVRTRREHIAALVQRAEQLERERDQEGRLATAAERARIARELHDVVAHNLTVMVTLADGARLTAPSTPAQADAAMGDVSTTGREALREMRRLLGVLREEPAEQADGREPAGDDAGPGAAPAPLAPQPGIDQLDALLEQVRRTGLAATLTRVGEPVPLSPGAELTVYRVVQEALTNTLKHAHDASRAAVRLDYRPDALAVEVTDDGRFADVTPSASSAPTNGGGHGHGIDGMRERLAPFGAEVEAGPQPHGGWRVRTRLRLDDAEAAR